MQRLVRPVISPVCLCRSDLWSSPWSTFTCSLQPHQSPTAGATRSVSFSATASRKHSKVCVHMVTKGRRPHASVHDVVDGLMLWSLLSAGEKELVVLGDFGCSPQSSDLDVLRKEKFCPLVPPTQFTNISTRSPQGSRCLDNIWLSRSIKKVFSGKTPPRSRPLDGLSVFTGDDSPDRQNRTDHGQP